MKIGYIGLGKMGLAMVERLIEKKHVVVANNRSNPAIDKAVSFGAEGAYSIKELVQKLETPRTVWLMVPHEAVDSVLDELLPLLEKGDVVIDGGNSPYFKTLERVSKIKDFGVNFLDIGTSGGPGGARNGACLMCGGEKEIFERYTELFADLSVPNGFGYMGSHGAGHFVKMIHNGIEYGMMQAIGEGFEIMKKAKEFNLDLPEIARVYNNGSVIESRLVGWLCSAFSKHGAELKEISGEVSHSGEGEWTVKTAEELNVPAQVIKDAFQFRINSKDNPSYTGKVVSALRNEFGGHNVDEK